MQQHCTAYNMLMTSQVDYHLLPHASHYSETAVFPIREMNPFADDLHKHLSVLCLPLIPNEFQALTVLCCSLPCQSQDVLSRHRSVDFVSLSSLKNCVLAGWFGEQSSFCWLDLILCANVCRVFVTTYNKLVWRIYWCNSFSVTPVS